MKKIILITLLFAAFAMPDKVRAQSPILTYTMTPETAKGVKSASVITTTNVDTTFFVVSILKGSSDSGAIRIDCDVVVTWSVVPSITGTTSGTISIQGSETGVFSENAGDWVDLISDVTQYNGSSSVAISGTSTVYGYFILPKLQLKYIRVRYRTTGTQTSTATCKVFIKPRNAS